MRQFVIKRTRRERIFTAVEAFDADQHLEAAIAKELAEIEGLEAEIVIGADVADVISSVPAWFAEPVAA